MPNVNDSPLFQNRLLLDLSNGFNPSRELPICIAVSVDGQRCGFSPELLTSDPAPFVGLTNSTVIYGMETGEKRQDRTIYKIRQRTGGVGFVRYPLVGPSQRPGDSDLWWDYNVMRMEADEARGDLTLPVMGAAGIFVRDRGARVHPVLEEPIQGRTQQHAIYVGSQVEPSHTGLLQTRGVQDMVLSRLGLSLEQDLTVKASESVRWWEVIRDRVTMYFDPVEAFLVDASNRRVGWSEETGAISEIPGSYYFGEADGFGMIPLEAVEWPLRLVKTGLGEDYFISITIEHDDEIFDISLEGFLERGQQEVIPIYSGFPAPPQASDDLAVTYRNQAISIPVLNNDVPGLGVFDLSKLTITVPPASGHVQILPSGEVEFTPSINFHGEVQFSYSISNIAGLISNPADVRVVVYPSKWQNTDWPLDVNTDGRVSAIDALQIINVLNSNIERFLPDSSMTSPPFVDTNGDERVSALDALLVINYLNQRSGAQGGEGESNYPGETYSFRNLAPLAEYLKKNQSAKRLSNHTDELVFRD